MTNRLLAPLLAVTGTYNALLGAYMWIAPGSFFHRIGPYPPRNDHFIGDVATFQIAFGLGLLAAWRRPAWRVPVLAVVVVQYALHVINHAIDINASDKGASNFVALFVITAILGWMLAAAVRESRA